MPESMLKQISDVGAFFHKIAHAGVIAKSKTPIANIAKSLNIGVPTLVKNCTILTPTSKDGFKKDKLMTIFTRDGKKPPVSIDRTKTWCYMACGDVPFAGFKCIMVCVTCTTEWGGGCQISIYPPD